MVEQEKKLKHFKEVKAEKIAIQSQLNEAQEDLVDERELLGMQTQTTDIWQGRFDKVYEIAKKMGADASVLNAIRDKPLTQGYKRESYYIYTHKYLYIFIQSLFIHSCCNNLF